MNAVSESLLIELLLMVIGGCGILLGGTFAIIKTLISDKLDVMAKGFERHTEEIKELKYAEAHLHGKGCFDTKVCNYD